MAGFVGVLNFFDINPLKYIPGDKGLMDSWSITMGANDRTTLFGPSMSFNLAGSYSTSYDVVSMLLNCIMNKCHLQLKNRTNLRMLFGNGDIKLALGPSTSLLYGGPAGSSKRGPFWDRIAGTWWEPRGKGAKYSASGSFSPGSVGKGGKDGLQFFERDQIYGEQNRSGQELGVYVKTGKKQKITVGKMREKLDWDAFVSEPVIEEGTTTGDEIELDNVKKDKYESDLAKCYTKTELEILKQGDKAARIGTVLLLILDLAVNAFAIIITRLEASGITGGKGRGSWVFNDPQNDTGWNKIVMLVRMIYKFLKILGMQIMEIFESTERLARIVITNVDKCTDVDVEDYAENTYLSIEKRAECSTKLIEEAKEKIKAEIKAKPIFTPQQIKEVTEEAIKTFKANQDKAPVPVLVHAEVAVEDAPVEDEILQM